MPPTDNLPKVSVIIPTYNRADLIGEAIQSVINQTYPNWELIVVDDGSTDDTARVVAGFGERVRYIYQDNAGVCNARNLGFAESQGEFITFLDSDDCMLPHNIEILLGLLDTRPDVDIAYGWGYFYRQENNQRKLMDYQRIQGETPLQLDQPWDGVDGSPGGAILEGQILPQLLLEDSMLLGANLIRRACVDAVGGFDTSISYMEHWDFYLRLAQAGFTYACSRQAVMLYRNHVGNRFRDASLMLQDRLTVLNRIFVDPAWESRLVDVRNRAYFLAYFENSLASFSYGSLDLGVQSLNAALGYTRILPNELTQLAGCIAKRIIDESTVDALGLTNELFIKIDQTAQASLLRKKVLALVHMSLAFRDYRSGDSRIASRHALAAMRHDLSMWRNRGLVRVLIDGLGGASILDWARSRRQRLIKDLSSIIADRPCVFISPHFDDVVLSCGGTLAQISKIDASILLVTVFTADHNEQMSLSPLAQRMHELWGGFPKPFEVRKDEDKATAEHLDAEYRWLEFPDVIYRYQTLQENEILQPMFDPRGDACFELVRAEMLHILNDYPDGVVFVPLGVGYHRDHLIVHEAVKDAAQMAETRCTLIFYEDFPYAVLSDTKQRLSEISVELEPFTVDISPTLSERVRLTQMHASQMKMLFGDVANIEKEIQNYAQRVGTMGKPRERFWSSHDALNHRSK